jgi:ATP-binding cassette subfamily B protein
MHIISYLIFIVGVFILLFSASKEATFGVFSSIGLIYLTISILSRKRIKENGKKISQLSTAVIKKMQEGIGSIRDILIDNSQKVFVREFEKINFSYRNAQGNNYFISLAPRYFVETVSIVVIVIISYFMLIKIGSNSVIPILGMIALSSQKLIPAIQQVYMSYINIVGAKESLNDLFKILESPLLNSDKNPRIDRKHFFSKKIKLKNVSFRYNSDSQLILNNVNLTINKGDFLGVIGGTGQGKSTLVDIMMTLLSPSSGDLFFDEKKMDDKALWRGLISHVPQSIFLIDGSIYQNIAFGVDVEDIDHNLAKGAAKLACIFDDIKAFPDGFETNIGENGCRLSGGQRQRIGIARAMYRNSEVLILDEATSALDIVTEEKVINSLKNINNKKTVIIITHKEASLKWCNRVIEVKNGSIVERIDTNILMSNKIENG